MGRTVWLLYIGWIFVKYEFVFYIIYFNNESDEPIITSYWNYSFSGLSGEMLFITASPARKFINRKLNRI